MNGAKWSDVSQNLLIPREKQQMAQEDRETMNVSYHYVKSKCLRVTVKCLFMSLLIIIVIYKSCIRLEENYWFILIGS